MSIFKHLSWSSLLLGAVVFAAACSSGGKSEQSAAAPATAPAAAAPAAAPAAPAPAAAAPAAAPGDAAEAIFQQRCVTCHGNVGHGDGPAAASLNPKPASFADAAWQAAITDEAIDKVILGGGGAVGKSPTMPPNPDLADKPEVVAALRAKIRAFAGK